MRASGILHHISALPSNWGIGDLGPEAYQFLDFLVQAKQTFWQLLPLGPTGWGNSPYMCFSAFAGNPLLISPDLLIQQGYLDPEALPEKIQIPRIPKDKVDFGVVIPFKQALLNKAWIRFQTQPDSPASWESFCQTQASWLPDYSLFMALKEVYSGQEWINWPSALALRDPSALAEAQQTHADLMAKHRFWQFLFFEQWYALKQAAQDKGIQLIGDLPIYVARDSADVWVNRHLFELDPDGQPQRVAGVPPDYFSADGQLWGNPLYNWEAMKETQYGWYIERLRSELDRFDYVRIDHFRGFVGYYAIPYPSTTAKTGDWIQGPGSDLFRAAQESLGENLAIIAEDLGIITDEVNQLREEFQLKGMKVLQFAFDTFAIRNMFPDDPNLPVLSSRNPYLPCNYSSNYIVYTGTHDNNTLAGWFWDPSLPTEDRQALLDYLGTEFEDYQTGYRQIHWDMIRLALASVADWAIVPLQDILGLGREARMNTPGTSEGNWSWRCSSLDPSLADTLAHLTRTYGR